MSAPRELIVALSLLLFLAMALAAGLVVARRRSRRLLRHAHHARRYRNRIACQRRANEARGFEDAKRYWQQIRESTAPVLVTSPHGAILAASPPVVEMFGFSDESELKSASILDLYANPLDRARLSARLTQDGYMRSGEFRMRHRNGHEFHLLATVRVHTAEDATTCYESVLTDITELRQAAEERQRLMTQLHLARKLELIGQLASGIAHEINTPMQFIGDNIKFLKRAFERLRPAGADGPGRVSDGLVADMTSAFEGSLEGVERVSETVRAMKEFAHPGDLEIASTDLNQALRTTLVVARNEYKHAAEVELDLQEIPAVDCRRAEINKVFLNLIVNAAHAIEARGVGAPGRIGIRTASAAGLVRIEISDNGCGIPPAVLPRIFDPFFTTKAIGKGSGQGLAIAQAIIKDHGGEFAVSSAVGQGTTFTITLPSGQCSDPEFGNTTDVASDLTTSIG